MNEGKGRDGPDLLTKAMRQVATEMTQETESPPSAEAHELDRETDEAHPSRPVRTTEPG